MLRYMAGVTWRDRVRSAEVARRCGVRACGEKGGDGDLGKDSASSMLWRRGGGHLEDLKRPGEVCKKNLQV